MIAKLTGIIAAKALDQVLLDVHDVGYRVSIPLSTYYDLSEVSTTVSLQIHTYVREDTFQLFGFLTTGERDVFEALLRVTKVGPRLALAILSAMSAEDVQQAVLQGDIPRLSATPGVGRKTAERIVLELRERFAKTTFDLPLALTARAESQPAMADAVIALLNLGYPRAVAERTISQVLRSSPQGSVPALKELIRASLKALGQEKGQ